MQTLFSPKSLEFKPEHQRAASWFATICSILEKPTLRLTCHLQKDGSQIMKYAEEHGRNFVYYFQVWPDGRICGGREVPNNE